jgi:glycosyltransferase involved in cell wall biosynthesis
MSIENDPIALVRDSGLFDEAWYVARYPDVKLVGIDPAEHFLRFGAALRRQPGPAFDTAYYLDTNPDVAEARVNPLLHFVEHGRLEGRRCRPLARPVFEAPADAGGSGERAGVLPINRIPGRRARGEGRRTVLLCAHVSGQHLFGSERSLIDILDGLIAAGHDVITTVPGSRAGAYQDAIRERSVAVLSYRYDWWRKGVPLNEAVVATLASIIDEYAIDAVHVNTIMLREPLVAARRMNVPGLVHVREIITHDQALCDLIGETPERIVELVLAAADHVIANSEATARTFAKPGATHVVPNTIETGDFDLANPVEGDEVRISLISSNLPKKGIFDFVEVARRVRDELPSARFLLVGPENEHVVALREKQAAGEVPDNLVFAGYRDTPVAALADAHVICNFSHFQESFGRTVLEAMAARRPVVAYNWGALAELVDDDVNGRLVPFGDVDAAAQALVALCRDRGTIARFGEAGRAKAVAGYGKDAYAAKLGQAYENVFAQAAATPKRPLTLPARRNAAAPAPEGPLRIAYFLWHFPVPSETFVLNELRILVEQGHDVKVFCKQSPYKDFQPDFPVQWARVENAEALAKQLADTGRQIVHSHFTYPTVTEMVWPACELAGVPFTFIAHAQDIFRHSNDEKNRIGEIGRSPLCVRVLVPSRFHREYVIERGVPADKILINPNGIDPELYASAIDPAKASRPHRSVCAIHRFTAKKGLEQLILAGRELAADGVQIHLYGYGDLEGRYRELIVENGLANVHLHGSVDGREAMLDVFARHDLFACPSVRAPDGDMDGIPTVLMEAMASGLPVLTSDLSGIPDLVQDGVNGFVCEPTPAAIAATVRRYYALPDAHVQAVIEEAAETIRRDYHAGKLTATLVRLWRGDVLDVLIVSWNNLPELREVVRRLYKYTMLPFHLVICDNDSRGDVVAWLNQLYAERDNVTVVLNRANSLVGPGTNIGLANSRSEFAVYVCGKEGFVLNYGWEKPLLQYMREHPDVGLAGTLCYSPSYLYGRQYPEQIPLFAQFRNPQFAAENPDRKFGHVQGGFFVMRRKMIDEIGGFSEAVPHNYTDVEFSYYAESRGWKLGAAPRMLALFNKTRPGLLSRIDDSVYATHPPTLQDLELLDRLSRRQGAYCNCCGWHAAAFEDGPQGKRCESCGSSPADRSLFRFIAESMLTYRRLPALGVNIGPALDKFWRHQFQNDPVTAAALRDEIHRTGRLRFNDRRVKLIGLRGVLDGGPGDDVLMKEITRVIADDGMLIVQGLGDGAPVLDDAFRARWGFAGLEPVRYASVVGALDPNRLFVLRRVEADLCVS